MTIKTCTCGKHLTTKIAKFIGRQFSPYRDLLMFNCPVCNSTTVISSKKRGVK